MGIIRAITSAIGGGLGDEWLEVYESDYMGPTTITAPGVVVRKNDPRNSNKKGTADTISNGSLIQVKEGQFMLLVDGGKVIDYSGEAGYFKVDNSSMPSLFNGELGDSLKETFNRVRFSGSTPYKQTTYFLNMQEVRGLKFGTPAPVNYYDNFYNAELFLRAHGSYTIRITDPLKFYIQVADHDADSSIDVADMSEQYRNEFLTAFQTALNKMSADGERISFVLSRGDQLAEYMQDVLDEKWQALRGFQVESVAIASISYDEESQKLINMRNQGAMLSDASIREGYVQGSIARGLESAGSNEAGAGQGFFGMGVGMSTIGGGFGTFSQNNAEQIRQQQAGQGKEAAAPVPATPSTGNTDPSAVQGNAGVETTVVGAATGAATASASWTCPQCGTQNSGKFCTECGTKKPDNSSKCPKCGHPVTEKARFCPECGQKLEPPAETPTPDEL
ncbi:SPFH domain-containing protein [Murdochiella vaginalis]|uniref:SPFH domain-containing protein n=1 Tax=Murdochiella vaginalis TaxID=1852373 RepID=UPI0008FDE8B5|nr:SPFH domain-containing protein [Murdochiella vaginalis]